MLPLIALLTVTAYLLAAREQRGGRLAVAGAGAAILLHAYLIQALATDDGRMRIGVSLAVSLMAWQTATLLWLAARRAPLQPLRRPVYGIAALAALLPVLLPGTGGEVMVGDWRIRLHVALSLLSMGLLTLGAIQAVLLAAQERYVHARGQGGGDSRIPPLQTMEFLLFAFVGAGFALLSLTLLTGLVFVEDLLAQHLAHKTVLSLLAWAMLGALMLGRWKYGWRGRTAIRWTLSGYAVLLLAYFGSKFVLEALLGRQWS